MDNTLIFNTRDELTCFSLDRVMYFEADANYTTVVLVNGVHTSLLISLTRLEKLIGEILRDRRSVFVRIGKKYIINSAFIFQINALRQRLVLTDLVSPNAVTLTVSKDALKKLKSMCVMRQAGAAPKPMAVPLDKPNR